MFGIGKKDKDGKQTRIEYRDEYLRASRTGGIAGRAETKAGPVTITANTNHGLRVSARLARGARVGFQNGRAQFIGRWRAGPLALNASKSGASASLKNSMGTFNFLKPRYSSFKFGGVQIRGKNAAVAQLIFMGIALAGILFVFAVQTAFWLFMLALQVTYALLWLGVLVLIFIKDIIVGMIRGEQGDKNTLEHGTEDENGS